MMSQNQLAGLVVVTVLAAVVNYAPPTAKAESEGEEYQPLAISDHHLTYISSVKTASLGQTISVVISNKNLGTQNSLSSTCKFYLSTNQVAAAAWHVNNLTLGPISVNATRVATNIAFTVPTAQPTGSNYIIGVSGFGDVDKNLSNNTNSTVVIIIP